MDQITPLGIRWIKLREKFRLKYEKQQNKGKQNHQIEPLIAVMYEMGSQGYECREIAFIPISRRQDIIDLCGKFKIEAPFFLFDEEHKNGVDLKSLPLFNFLMESWVEAYGAHSITDFFWNQKKVPCKDLKIFAEFFKDHDVPPRLVGKMRENLMSGKYADRFSSIDILWIREWLNFYQVLAEKIKFSDGQQHLEPLLYRDGRSRFLTHRTLKHISFVSTKRRQEIEQLYGMFKASTPVFLFDINEEEYLKMEFKSLPNINFYFVQLIQSYDFGYEKYFKAECLELCKPHPIPGVTVSVDEMRNLVDLAQQHKEKYKVSVCVTPLIDTLYGRICKKEHTEEYPAFLFDLIQAYPKEAAEYSLKKFPEKDRRVEVLLCFKCIQVAKNILIPKVIQNLILQKLFVQYLVDSI